MHSLPLSFKTPPLTLNGRYHWAARNRLNAAIKDEVVVRCRAAKLKPAQRVRVRLCWVPRTKGRRDEDNPTPTLKACLDGLVVAGVIPDDTPEYVEYSRVIIEPYNPKDHGMRLEVEYVD